MATDNDSAGGENLGSLIGLCAISFSSLLVEIVLTKFLGFKFFHHMTFAVLSVVILSSGASGVLLYCFPKLFGVKKEAPWDLSAKASAWYSISLCIAIPIFCFVPIFPDFKTTDIWRMMSMPMLFLLLGIPFFCSGLCISQTLAQSKRPVTQVYAWDLLAAALGAVSCSWVLSTLGGYGTVALAAGLGLVGALAYWYCDRDKNFAKQGMYMALGALTIVILLGYPEFALKTISMDISSFKEIGPKVVLRDFKGLAYTHWNSIARVDVSKTGTSKESVFRYGLSPDTDKLDIIGRYILLDGGANTRQFKNVGPIEKQDYLGTALWASPYVAVKDAKDTLIIGGGGGIDILVAKYFGVPDIKVVEMNPAIYRILKGEMDDPNDEYSPWLRTDKRSNVQIFHDEARHFSTTQPAGSFDVIQASGVDTLAAMQTGGMSLVENYLYTTEAVAGDVKMLKPGGVLSLTHWRTNGPATSLRMFATYFAYLDGMGVKEPWKQVVVVGGPTWTDALLKTTPYTSEDLSRLREWVKKSHLVLLFDPERHHEVSAEINPTEKYYDEIGFLDAAARAKYIAGNKEIPFAVNDDKPYFYQIRNRSDEWVNLHSSALPLPLMLSTLFIGILFLVLPLFKAENKNQLSSDFLIAGTYFAVCGFAFLLYETTIIQVFSVMVGGPMYSLTVVLVSVLFGYSIGSFLAQKLKPTRATFLSFAGIFFVMFASLYFAVPIVNTQLLPLALPVRLVICGGVALVPTVVIGMVVSSAMGVVRENYGDAVSWMWGISAIFNALGSMCFVALTQFVGISSCLLIVAVMYGLANLMIARFKPLVTAK